MNVASPASDRKWVPRILRCFGVVPPGGFRIGGDTSRQIPRGFNTANETDSVVSSEPGIVARLMGLEALPSTEKIQIRSGSMKLSVLCDYQELQDDEFFILSFEHMDKLKRRRGVKKEVSDPGSEFRNKKTRKHEEEAENSSPSSVLEFSDQQPGEFSRLMNSKMRRTLSDELDSCGSSVERTPSPAGAGGKKVGLTGRNRGLFSAVEWDEMGALAAAETVSASHRDHAQGIGAEISSAILDLLVNEVLIALAPPQN